MTPKTADFTESEMWIIKTTLEERYKEPLQPFMADTEVRLDPFSSELTECPAVVWEDNGCHLVVIKTGDQSYRAQFYYRVHEMFGTGIEQFDDLSECMVTLLQVQADHAAALEKAGP